MQPSWPAMARVQAVDAGHTETHWSALAADAFYPPAAFPFLGHVLGNGELVALDVWLAVVHDAPAVADTNFDLLLSHVVLQNHEVGKPLTRLMALGLGVASASLHSLMKRYTFVTDCEYGSKNVVNASRT